MEQSASLWCQSLENVLNDGDALQIFISWVRYENSEHPLRFHFSVVAYKEMIGRKDEKSIKLAREIYKKYLDPQKGVCQFVDLETRKQIGQKLLNSETNETLFDPCLPFIHSFLRKQHAQFITSDLFIEFLNSYNALNRPSTSSAILHEEFPPAATTCTPVMTRRSNNTQSRKHKESNNLLSTQKLTPEILLRSQRERELILGQSSVEKMFQPPLTKYPYVCNATTSKNDSAVSSNFSSEANSHHKRTNAHYSSQSTRTQQTHQQQHAQRLNALAQRIDGSGSGFRHETDDGRHEFADALSKRLHELDEKINRSERINEQIQMINKQAMFSARDVISSEMKIAPYSVVDEEDDLDNYVKQRMIEDSGKPSPSQQQSPAGLTGVSKMRRRSPKSCSPEYFPSAAHHHQQQQQPKYNNIMSQSYFDPSSHHPMRMTAFQQAHKFNQQFQQTKLNGFKLRSDDEDTSGICSMVTTSQFSAASNHHQFKDRRDRHTGSNSKSSATRRQKMPNELEFSSLPRQRNQNSSNGLIKISYKASDGVPIVAHIPRPTTFREFRKCFGIPANTNKRFFFKTKSDDAPYQLLLIDEDSTILPVFEGTIAAECRSLCESE